MKLLPGNADEYKKRHDEIWPELAQALKNAGISNYRIFLDKDTETDTNNLFAVMDQSDATKVAALRDLPIMRKWWDSMAPLMQTSADNEPITTQLDCVFYLP